MSHIFADTHCIFIFRIDLSQASTLKVERSMNPHDNLSTPASSAVDVIMPIEEGTMMK